MPTRPEPFLIYCDTREKCPPPFPEGVTLVRASMGEADYTTEALQGVAVVERKSVADYVQSIGRDRERFDDEIRRLREYRWKCIVVEGDLSAVYRSTAMHPHSILGTIASMQARWDVPTLFAVNPAGAGRLIAGLLRRWEQRLSEEAKGGEAA